MEARLSDKVALITGAGSGIGRASALRFAAEGARIMCSDLDRQAAEGTAALIDEQGGNADAMALDVTDEGEVIAALEKTKQRFGKLNVLFNNAGVGGGFTWDQTIAVNLTGVFNGVFHASKMFAEQGGGSIINTASIAGLVGLRSPGEFTPDEVEAGSGAYIAAKHGVAGLTKQYAVTFGKFGVRVNAIAPGYIETPMTAELREEEGGEDFLIDLHPLGRLGQPEEIASAAAFLASDDASFINGIVLPVDGGYTAQ
jgi:NAD(P)-dependent dehydrogenase (short-subunit alcohol dehydrogenase family)